MREEHSVSAWGNQAAFADGCSLRVRGLHLLLVTVAKGGDMKAAVLSSTSDHSVVAVSEFYPKVAWKSKPRGLDCWVCHKIGVGYVSSLFLPIGLPPEGEIEVY